MEATEAHLKDARILLVDDTPANLNVLCELLEARGCRISMAPSGSVALRLVPEVQPDLILLDVLMPDMDGYEVCRRLKENEATRDVPIIFITANSFTEGVMAGFQVGGVDYIAKPFQSEEVRVRVQTHLQLSRLRRELQYKNEELARKNRLLEDEIAQRKQLKGQLSLISEREAAHWGLEGFVGQSPTLQKIFKNIRLLQESATTSVLIFGESGTGKELIARALHFGGARKEAPFVPVNCAALPAELVESLLFGHAKGAFTGAVDERVGYFEMANGGTLFLDEMGEMPPSLQAKLLRVLEGGEVQRIGEATSRKVDVRVVAATNVNMQEKIRDGGFRQDLYFRLARFTVELPPLRERREDLPLLARHFLAVFAREMGREAPPLEAKVLEALHSYAFPGNVRELKNIIERALIESAGGAIRPNHLHFLPSEAPSQSESVIEELPLDLERAELLVIKKAMARTGGNISEAARLLKTNRNRIYRALAQQEHGNG